MKYLTFIILSLLFIGCNEVVDTKVTPEWETTVTDIKFVKRFGQDDKLISTEDGRMFRCTYHLAEGARIGSRVGHIVTTYIYEDNSKHTNLAFTIEGCRSCWLCD